MRVNISNMLLDVEYDMLVLSARFGKERKDKESEIDEELIDVCDVLLTGGQIFLFVSLRALPVGARVVEIYLSRIMAAIRRDNLLEIWNKFASYDALLWALFMSTVAATNRPERDTIISYLREVVAVLGIKNQEILEVHLVGMAWADFFLSYSAEVSKEIFRARSQPLSQPLGYGIGKWKEMVRGPILWQCSCILEVRSFQIPISLNSFLHSGTH